MPSLSFLYAPLRMNIVCRLLGIFCRIKKSVLGTPCYRFTVEKNYTLNSPEIQSTNTNHSCITYRTGETAETYHPEIRGQGWQSIRMLTLNCMGFNPPDNLQLNQQVGQCDVASMSTPSHLVHLDLSGTCRDHGGLP